MKLDMELNKPIHDIHPQEWKKVLDPKNELDYISFRNVVHFINYMSKISQKEDMMCGISFKEYVSNLKNNVSQLKPGQYESIRNLVRTNLLKRGLITEEVYESYKYDVEGVAVDVAKVIDEDPQCMLKPAYSYTNYFYELYINISYPGSVNDATVIENLCKILATIEELERQHIYIKITIVDCSLNVANGKDYIMVLPLFSHKDHKSIETMSAVINEKLLRKGMFAMSEDIYEERLAWSYGEATELPKSIRPINISEIELFTDIYDKVITGTTR